MPPVREAAQTSGPSMQALTAGADAALEVRADREGTMAAGAEGQKYDLAHPDEAGGQMQTN